MKPSIRRLNNYGIWCRSPKGSQAASNYQREEIRTDMACPVNFYARY